METIATSQYNRMMGVYDEKRIEECLRDTNFITDGKKYVFAKLPFSDYTTLLDLAQSISDPFFEIILYKFEVTVVVEDNIWQNIKEKLNPEKVEFPLGNIHCEVSKHNPSGYLLKILEVLSPNNIGVYVQGAYTTDNILVDYDDLEKALGLLKTRFG